jgi:phosphohistidine swiveling domain-containing protein
VAGRRGQGNQTTVPHLPVPPARPPGLWLRAEVDYPRPLTPFTSAWLLPGLSAASRPALRDLGAMVDRIEYREIDGYVYRRVVPFGPTRRPAALFRPIAKALARVRPATRRRLNVAIRSMRTRSYKQTLDRWDAEWRGRLRVGAEQLSSGEWTALEDRALDHRIEAAVRLSQEGARIHAQVAFAALIALGRFIRDCRAAGVGDSQAFALVSTGGSSAPILTGTEESPASAAAEIGSCFPLWREAAEQMPAELDLPPSPGPGGVSSVDERSGAMMRVNAPDPANARHAQVSMQEAEALALDLPLALVRPLARALGERLAEREQIDGADDLFYLTPDEARAALRAGEPQQERVAGRRSAYERALSANPAAILGSAPAWPLDLLPGEAREMVAAILTGLEAIEGRGLESASGGPTGVAPELAAIGVASGVAMGSVRHLRRVADLASLQSGEIAVCAGASYSLAPFVSNCAALVAASGGQMSPVAVVARRLGVPAVVGFPIESLVDGERVEVDGAAGTVRRDIAQDV